MAARVGELLADIGDAVGAGQRLTGADLAVTEELVGVWWALHRESLGTP